MSRRRPGGLTTTSFAMLGLLAIRPWTTYELARHMDRALDRLWPRAASKLYEEPKKLEAQGLVTARPESVGRRPRTVYAITAKGRRALRAWLDEPGAGPSLEFEALMKVFFSDHGTRDGALANIAAIRQWAEDEMAQHAAVASEYAAGAGPFQHRGAQVAITGQFLVEFAEMVARWAAWAEGIVSAWPDDPSEATPERGVWENVLRRSTGNGRRARTASHANAAG